MMKKISRRSFLQVCGITAATAALTACGSGKAEGDKSSGHREQRIEIYYTFIGAAEGSQIIVKRKRKAA